MSNPIHLPEPCDDDAVICRRLVMLALVDINYPPGLRVPVEGSVEGVTTSDLLDLQVAGLVRALHTEYYNPASGQMEPCYVATLTHYGALALEASGVDDAMAYYQAHADLLRAEAHP